MDSDEMLCTVYEIEKLHRERSYNPILVLLADLQEAQVTSEQLETTNMIQVLCWVLNACLDEIVKNSIRGLLGKWKRKYIREKGYQRIDIFAFYRGCFTSAFPVSDRWKCVQLLLAALEPEPPDVEKATKLAQAIEQELYQLHSHNHVKYKVCVRSKLSNLKNPKSNHLRLGLMEGSLSAETFARMTAEEMASADLRRLRKDYLTQALNERQLPQLPEGTPTEKVRCETCGGRQCTVTQLSRVALFLPSWVMKGGPGEDAMTFIRCCLCGKFWYHGDWICF